MEKKSAMDKHYNYKLIKLLSSIKLFKIYRMRCGFSRIGKWGKYYIILRLKGLKSGNFLSLTNTHEHWDLVVLYFKHYTIDPVTQKGWNCLKYTLDRLTQFNNFLFSSSQKVEYLHIGIQFLIYFSNIENFKKNLLMPKK